LATAASPSTPPWPSGWFDQHRLLAIPTYALADHGDDVVGPAGRKGTITIGLLSVFPAAGHAKAGSMSGLPWLQAPRKPMRTVSGTVTTA
jgi:hypothetical protein